MSDRSSKRDNDVVTPDSYIAIGNRQSQIGNYQIALVGGNAEFGQNSTLRLKAAS